MKELFPIFSSPESTAAMENLPLYTDVQWDFAGDVPVFADGEPVMVHGAEAVRTWCWNAIKTARYRYEMFDFSYGCELDSLVGAAYTDDTKRAEAVRYIREALEANPYIQSAAVDGVALTDATFSAVVSIKTIYGEVNLNA